MANNALGNARPIFSNTAGAVPAAELLTLVEVLSAGVPSFFIDDQVQLNCLVTVGGTAPAGVTVTVEVSFDNQVTWENADTWLPATQIGAAGGLISFQLRAQCHYRFLAARVGGDATTSLLIMAHPRTPYTGVINPQDFADGASTPDTSLAGAAGHLTGAIGGASTAAIQLTPPGTYEIDATGDHYQVTGNNAIVAVAGANGSRWRGGYSPREVVSDGNLYVAFIQDAAASVYHCHLVKGP